MISVPRNVVELVRNSGEGPRSTHEPTSLDSVRDVHAYVLLGDPGLGKTTTFKQEAAALGLEIIRARDFISLPQAREQWMGKTIFVDGLDETRAGGRDGRTVLDAIRNKLVELGTPRFRLSCRKQDWLGARDQAALEQIVVDVGALRVFRLTELSDDNIRTLLKVNHNVSDSAQFVREAERLGLDALLRNPQTLRVLAAAIGNGGDWPTPKLAAFEFACKNLVTELNGEHQVAKRKLWPSEPALLDAAGFLSAIYLCANRSAITLNSNADADESAAQAERLVAGDRAAQSQGVSRRF